MIMMIIITISINSGWFLFINCTLAIAIILCRTEHLCYTYWHWPFIWSWSISSQLHNQYMARLWQKNQYFLAISLARIRLQRVWCWIQYYALYHKFQLQCGSLRNYFFRKILPYLTITIPKEWENASGARAFALLAHHK